MITSTPICSNCLEKTNAAFAIEIATKSIYLPRHAIIKCMRVIRCTLCNEENNKRNYTSIQKCPMCRTELKNADIIRPAEETIYEKTKDVRKKVKSMYA